jgi:hypothetical protein
LGSPKCSFHCAYRLLSNRGVYTGKILADVILRKKDENVEENVKEKGEKT